MLKTVPDTYPLPRIDDLLSEAKPTPYMSTIDLRSRLSSAQNANREKCHFCCEKVKYLGHYITKHGIAVDPHKTAAIADMPSPKTVKQVQSFVQTCSWYRRYIYSKFSQIAKPLTDLTKKKALWKWEAQQENAFQELKSKLISPPILKQADGTKKPFIIRTDASNVAIGAVLLQGEKNEEHPIEYASRLLNFDCIRTKLFHHRKRSLSSSSMGTHPNLEDMLKASLSQSPLTTNH
ncbi:uncharacterized mitochondrial protein AtMg00860-like [Stegodyphus dumicola]|uniref:uncharacterized mitochondrial protein AtMg00860-like n=1 Tax=Stegodyphus dumicola TaxID=202533 RepID=UPI0015AA4659|nr:uncharacterized mitochondrial protein AtMg00860-like [Stegodyphus dumicola]